MNEPLSKADLVRAVELSAQALREMLEEEEPVDAVMRGKYEMNLEQLAGQMKTFGERQMERAPARQPGTEWNRGWETGAKWMLEKMIGYVTGEKM